MVSGLVFALPLNRNFCFSPDKSRSMVEALIRSNPPRTSSLRPNSLYCSSAFTRSRSPAAMRLPYT